MSDRPSFFFKTMNFQEIITELKKPFPPEAHKERDLPGGGRWFYIPWQTIRDRLDDVYPEWAVSWSEPAYVGEYCVILCTITIAGVSRQAPGNAPIEMLSSKGKDMSRGTPIERATADAFKNAAESLGVARYLDDQPFVVKYLSKQGDMRGYKFAKENGEFDAGARGKPITSPTTKTITEGQAKRLWAIAKSELKLDDETIKSVQAHYGFEKTELITSDKYEVIINHLRGLVQKMEAITPSIDRDIVMREIDSLMKRKNISPNEAKAKTKEWFGFYSRSDLSDAQLVQLRDKFSLVLQNA